MRVLYIRSFQFSLSLLLTLSGIGNTLNAQPCELFREDFNGSTTFKEVILPYGVGGSLCAWAYAAAYQNNGTEHYLTLTSYAESDLRKTNLNLPFGKYFITLKWRTGADPSSNVNCGATHFDELFGASCNMPNRIVVINGTMVYEKDGQKNNFSDVSVMSYTGKIDSIQLLASGACSINPFYTYYDYLTIMSAEVLPKVNFGHVVEGLTVSFSDSTQNANTDPPLWEFGDGATSNEPNPTHIYEYGDTSYQVCLTRKNSCGTDSVCKWVTLGDSMPPPPPPTGFNYPLQQKNILIYPNPAKNKIFIISPVNLLNPIKVYNTMGELLYTYKDGHYSQTELPISGLKPGIHIIKIELEDKVITQKINILE